MDIHLYMLCYRFEALVASHYTPEQFGLYMAVGNSKLTKGNVLFFEIDPSFKSSYFKLDNLKERVVPHSDGRPKASKYISIYRVIEHIDRSAYGKLYLTTADGRTMALTGREAEAIPDGKGANLYEELCPVTPMVVSSLGPTSFAKFMTSPDNAISVPRIFFADMLVDFDEGGELAGYLPYPDPKHITDCIRKVEKDTKKPTKTISRHARMHGFFRTIRRGFFLGDPQGVLHYPFPSEDELQIYHRQWWRSASESLVS